MAREANAANPGGYISLRGRRGAGRPRLSRAGRLRVRGAARRLGCARRGRPARELLKFLARGFEARAGLGRGFRSGGGQRGLGCAGHLAETRAGRRHAERSFRRVDERRGLGADRARGARDGGVAPFMSGAAETADTPAATAALAPLARPAIAPEAAARRSRRLNSRPCRFGWPADAGAQTGKHGQCQRRAQRGAPSARGLDIG